MNWQKHMFAIFIGVLDLICVLILITSAGSPIINMIGAFLVGVFGLLSLLFYKYGYIFVPLVTRFTRVVQISMDGYEIPPEQDVIVKKNENGTYYASVFLGISVYESMTEKTDNEIMAYNLYFERAISNVRFPFKISYMLYAEDIEFRRQQMEAKRAEAQIRLSKELQKPAPDPITVDAYKREIAKWEHELDKLVKGYRPMAVAAYAMTTAVGVTKEAAIEKARAHARELEAVLTNALNVEVTHLTADEMLKAFEWEHFIPPSLKALDESIND